MPSPFAEQRGRGPGGGPTAVGFEDLAHSWREEGQVSGAREPRLLAVGHARGAVRQDSVEVGEVGGKGVVVLVVAVKVVDDAVVVLKIEVYKRVVDVEPLKAKKM